MEYMEVQAVSIEFFMHLFSLSMGEIIFILNPSCFQFSSFDFYVKDLIADSLSIQISLCGQGSSSFS